MKNIIIAASLASVFFQSSLASTVNLYVHNNSPTDAITIEKTNGERLIVLPQEHIKHVPFDEYSEPKAFVGNNYICKWVGVHSQDNLKLVGIRYDNPHGARFECLTMFIQKRKS